jgi:hypothetical protein
MKLNFKIILLLIGILLSVTGMILFIAAIITPNALPEISRGGFGGFRKEIITITPTPCAVKPGDTCSGNGNTKTEIKNTPTVIGAFEVQYPKTIDVGTSGTVTLTMLTNRLDGETYIIADENEVSESSKEKSEKDDLMTTPKNDLKISNKNITAEQFKDFEIKLESPSFEIKPDKVRTEEFIAGTKKSLDWIIQPKKEVVNMQGLILLVDLTYKAKNTSAKSEASADKPEQSQNSNNETEGVQRKNIESKTINIKVAQNWFDWATTRLGGFITFLVGTGLSVPFFVNWLKERKTNKPQKIESFADRIKKEAKQKKET